MAKSLYGALFDWIVLHINHAMLNRRDIEESVSVSHVMHLRLHYKYIYNIYIIYINVWLITDNIKFADSCCL